MQASQTKQKWCWDYNSSCKGSFSPQWTSSSDVCSLGTQLVFPWSLQQVKEVSGLMNWSKHFSNQICSKVANLFWSPFKVVWNVLKKPGRSFEKPLLWNPSNFWCGGECPASRCGARRLHAVAATGGRLLCQQKTCVCARLWQVLREQTVAAFPSPDVRCCPIDRRGSSLKGDVPAFARHKVPYPKPFGLLHLAEAASGC